MILDSVEAFKALKHYGIHVARSKAKAATVPGEDITIVGRTDESAKKIALQSATHVVERLIPLESAGAETMALEFRGHHHAGTSEQARRMLEHLLGRVSVLFEDSGVTAFRLGVRLHGNSYTVLDVSMTAPKALHFRERLTPHAHDRKGEGFHPDPVTEPQHR